MAAGAAKQFLRVYIARLRRLERRRENNEGHNEAVVEERNGGAVELDEGRRRDEETEEGKFENSEKEVNEGGD
jgi:hypothetical protein